MTVQLAACRASKIDIFDIITFLSLTVARHSSLQRAPDIKNLNATQAIMTGITAEEDCRGVAPFLFTGCVTVGAVGAILSTGRLSEMMGLLLVGGDGTGCCIETEGAAEDVSSCNIGDTHASNPSYSNGTFCRLRRRGNYHW